MAGIDTDAGIDMPGTQSRLQDADASDKKKESAILRGLCAGPEEWVRGLTSCLISPCRRVAC